MLNAKWSSSWGGYSNFVVESCGYSDTLDMVNLSAIHNQMIETNVSGTSKPQTILSVWQKLMN